MAITCNEIPFLDSKTYECSSDHTVRWLNRLAEEHNNLCAQTAALVGVIDDLKERVCVLEERMDNVEERLKEAENRLDAHDIKFAQIDAILAGYDITIGGIQNLFDTLVELLPMPYGVIAANGYKIAIGNINVMSANNGTPSIGTGIITSQEIEDNDIYFN